MRSWKSAALAIVLATTALLTGCTSPTSSAAPATSPDDGISASASANPVEDAATDDETTNTTTSTTAKVIMTKVNLDDFKEGCSEDVICWLPTQFSPDAYNEDDSVSMGIWPQEEDEVQLVCSTRGEELSNLANVSSDLWYGILVPTGYANVTDDSETGVPVNWDGDLSAEAIDGGFMAYVNSLTVEVLTPVLNPC